MLPDPAMFNEQSHAGHAHGPYDLYRNTARRRSRRRVIAFALPLALLACSGEEATPEDAVAATGGVGGMAMATAPISPSGGAAGQGVPPQPSTSDGVTGGAAPTGPTTPTGGPNTPAPTASGGDTMPPGAQMPGQSGPTDSQMGSNPSPVPSGMPSGEEPPGPPRQESDAGADLPPAEPDAGAEPDEEPAGFDPCPEAEPCKILPLGDSITDGLGVSGGGGYRIELFRLANDDGKSITYVGNSMNGPNDVDGVPFPKAHEGHSGWTIQQIDDIVPEPALDGDPHVVLLHIGTNDMYRGPEGAGDRLAALIDELLASLPDALLFVSTIIPFPGSDATVAAYNAEVVAVVNERVTTGERIVFVDQFEGFPADELADGVHPNAAGYARMAGKWYDAVSPYLK